jgi:hypothetical protein
MCTIHKIDVFEKWNQWLNELKAMGLNARLCPSMWDIVMGDG